MRSISHALRILFASLVCIAGSAVFQPASAMNDPSQPWGFNIGGGYSPTVGGLNGTLTDGWNFGIGLGYAMSESVAVRLEYMNQHLGVDQGKLDEYSSLLGGIDTDGSANVWSVTVNPTWSFELNRVVSGYLIGGGGYYHVKAQLTTPGLVYMPPYCDYYWGCWYGGIVPADRLIGERKDDTGGVNGGLGFAFNLGSGTQFYIESRYHYIFTDGPDLTLFPFTAGFRF